MITVNRSIANRSIIEPKSKVGLWVVEVHQRDLLVIAQFLTVCCEAGVPENVPLERVLDRTMKAL